MALYSVCDSFWESCVEMLVMDISRDFIVDADSILGNKFIALVYARFPCIVCSFNSFRPLYLLSLQAHFFGTHERAKEEFFYRDVLVKDDMNRTIFCGKISSPHGRHAHKIWDHLEFL